MSTGTTSDGALARLAMITIDCADPASLAGFYARVLGWDVAHSQDEYAMITGEGTAIGFGRSDDYAPPSWPNEHGTKQFHLDLAVPDVMAGQAACTALGATVPDFQPGGERWRVLLDPAGHPFCLTSAAAWS
jgi:predicted enzyme related to lactoylglutathione lyase